MPHDIISDLPNFNVGHFSYQSYIAMPHDIISDLPNFNVGHFSVPKGFAKVSFL